MGYRWGQMGTVFELELLLSQLGLDLGFEGAPARTILGLEVMWLMGIEWRLFETLMGLDFISRMAFKWGSLEVLQDQISHDECIELKEHQLWTSLFLAKEISSEAFFHFLQP